jgi:hypothetical protein
MRVGIFLQESVSLLWRLLAFFLVIVFIIGVWLSRGGWLYPDQIQTHQTLTEDLRHNAVGQTFVARQAGLEAIDIRLELPEAQTGALTLYLRDSPDAAADMQKSTVWLAGGTLADGWLRFPLKSMPDSRSRYYYFFIEPSADFPNDNTAIYYGPPDSYQDGALHVSGRPQEGQLAFRLSYNRPAMLYDLVRGMAASVPRGLIIILVFTLPGWAALVLFQINGKGPIIGHWIEGASVAVGLSMAFYPILFLWAYLFKWRPGQSVVWIVLAASALLLLWHYRPWQSGWPRISSGIRLWAASDTAWADSAFIFVLGVAAAGRLLLVRSFEMPFWHDSVQHAVIVQRIMETGGLFQSWLPYSPHTTFSFHFGFHLNTAVFGWVTGLSTPQAMIWGGQVFNLFAVLTLYALAYRLKGIWAGIIVVLVAGFFLQFPLFYTNWGRYPQLMGQAILPTAAWWTWVTLYNGDHKASLREGGAKLASPAWVTGGASLIAGTVLGYYPMSFHYLAFVVAAGIVMIQSIRDLLAWRKWATLLATAVITLIILLPWLGNLTTRLTAPMPPGAPTASVNLWSKIASVPISWPAPQLLGLLLGTLLILWWGKKVAVPAIWYWLLILLPIVAVLPLPGVNIIGEFTIYTSLYMPMSLIWAVIGGYILGFMPLRWLQPFVVLLIIGVALFQFVQMPRIVVPDFDLSSRPDMQAANWINKTVPADAFFLINGFEYKQTPAAGDAGWWLPLLTKRQTNIPPQYASNVERPIIEGYRQITTAFVEELLEQSPVSAEGKATICNFPYPISHVYIGQKRGLIKGPAPDVTPDRPLLPAQMLLEDPAFELLYQRDRVMIFAFDRAVCANE